MIQKSLVLKIKNVQRKTNFAEEDTKFLLIFN